jgi:hypothetical protein
VQSGFAADVVFLNGKSFILPSVITKTGAREAIFLKTYGFYAKTNLTTPSTVALK